jgi:hypothetical protein
MSREAVNCGFTCSDGPLPNGIERTRGHSDEKATTGLILAIGCILNLAADEEREEKTTRLQIAVESRGGFMLAARHRRVFLLAAILPWAVQGADAVLQTKTVITASVQGAGTVCDASYSGGGVGREQELTWSVRTGSRRGDRAAGSFCASVTDKQIVKSC